MSINRTDVMIENIFLGEKIVKMRRELIIKTIALLIVIDDDFSHIDINSIDEDAFEIIERAFNSFGDDGIKMWLLRFWKKPEKKVKINSVKNMAEIPGIPEYLAQIGHPEYLEITRKKNQKIGDTI